MEIFIETFNPGPNVLTLAFVGTLIAEMVQSRNFIVRHQHIARLMTGREIHSGFYSYFGFSAGAVSAYGLAKGSLALTIGGGCSLLSLFCALAILRLGQVNFKGLIIAAFCLLGIPAMTIFPAKDLAFLAIGLVVGYSLVKEAKEAWQDQLRPRRTWPEMISGFIASTFWLAYGNAANIWSLQVLYWIFSLTWMSLILAGIHFRRRKE